MPKKNDDIPLPNGWEMCQDFDGRVFFIDHNRQETSWIDPRDRLTKPADFSECMGDELPYGWEQMYDSQIGIYYTNHITKKNQVEDPRLEHLRAEQESMLKEYLTHVQEQVQNKRDICQVKQERLAIAREEVQHLNDTLARAHSSSLQSVSSSSSKYDPELLRGEVELAKKRVSRLKHEIANIQQQMQCKERGLETLSQVEQKLLQTADTEASVYSREDAHGIIAQIRSNYTSLGKAQEERRRLLAELSGLREEVYGQHRGGADSSPYLSTSSLSAALSTSSAASQTDLSGENAGNKWGEVARMRLQYNEAAQQLNSLQQQLADVEEQISPAQNESDKDRLLLISEKEQLLRELRSVNGRTKEEMHSIQQRINQLQNDLKEAMQQSNRQIAERIKLNENKAEILKKLDEATRLTSHLEAQMKSLSVSTLSISSGSSRGSLGSLASSKGSLSSLSFADIYAQPTLPDVDLPDLHRRVEKLLQGVNSPEDAGSNQYLATIVENPLPTSSISPRSSHSSLASGAGRVVYEDPAYAALGPQYGHVGGQMTYVNSAHGVGGDNAVPPPSYQQHIDNQRINPQQSSSQPNVYASSMGGNSGYQMSASHPNIAINAAQLSMNPAVLAMTEEYATAAGAALQQEYQSVATQQDNIIAPPGPLKQHSAISDRTYGSHGALHGISTDPSYRPHTSNLQVLADNILEGKMASRLPADQSYLSSNVVLSKVEESSQAAPPPPPYPGHVIREQISTQANTHLAPQVIPQSVSHPNLSYTVRTDIQQNQDENSSNRNIVTPVETATGGAKLSLPSENSSDRAVQGARPRSANSSVISSGRARPLSESSSRSGAGARSMGAAVSDESVAGDSGVFEAAKKQPTDLEKMYEMGLESAQIQIKLRYESEEGHLVVTVEQARNLSALQMPPHCHVCIKAALLPFSAGAAFQTSTSHNTDNPQFKETHRIAVPEHKLASKTLQVHVWCTNNTGAQEVLGSTLVSLAAFDVGAGPQVTWYNVLSFRFMNDHSTSAEMSTRSEEKQPTSSSPRNSRKVAGTAAERTFYKPPSTPTPNILTPTPMSTSQREESSDESTIISSQTSTLTRNQGPEAMLDGAGVGGWAGLEGDDPGFVLTESSEEEEEGEEQNAQFVTGEELDSDDNFSPEGTVRFVSVDKQTNTDQSGLLSRHHVTRQRHVTRPPIRRSQTFTPNVFRQSQDSLRNTLNRSDSDSSVRHRRDPFQRHAAERKSVRHRRSMFGLAKTHGSAMTLTSVKDKGGKTSLDLELDLQASQARLTQLDEDVQRLKLIKHKLQQAKTQGGGDPPKWLTENEALQTFLAHTDTMKSTKEGGASVTSEQRAEHLLRKMKREAQRMRKTQHTQQHQFREKMAQITSMATHVPLLPPDSDTDDDMTFTQGHARVKHKSKVSKQKVVSGSTSASKLTKGLGDSPQTKVDGKAKT